MRSEPNSEPNSGLNSGLNIGLMMFATEESLDLPAMARQAEALGFESLWLPEHPMIPVGFKTRYPGQGEMPEYYKHMPDPFVALAAAAGATTRLKLGTAISLVPERDPIHAAKQVATLDLVSGGRFLFGIGAGWLREESEAMGVDFPRRWSQTREHVLAMKALWTQPEASYHGRYVNFPPLWSYPKPVQKPHPPILIGGELDQAAARVAEYGDGWLPRHIATNPAGIEAGRRKIEALFRERGRDPSRLDVTLFGCRRDRAEIQRFRDAGVTRILFVLYPEAPQATLERMERLAEVALR
jgi:probable F420-dependent oxidoreductase